MKLTFEVSDELSLRFKRYLLDKHGTTYRVQQLELQKALAFYLDREMSTAPPVSEKETRKKDKPALDSAKKEEVRAYYAGGKNKGGHSRTETMRKFGLTDSQVRQIIYLSRQGNAV